MLFQLFFQNNVLAAMLAPVILKSPIEVNGLLQYSLFQNCTLIISLFPPILSTGRYKIGNYGLCSTNQLNEDIVLTGEVLEMMLWMVLFSVK